MSAKKLTLKAILWGTISTIIGWGFISYYFGIYKYPIVMVYFGGIYWMFACYKAFVFTSRRKLDHRLQTISRELEHLNQTISKE